MTLFEVTDPAPRAFISPDGVYRYWLTRSWATSEAFVRHVCWIMLNPSIADAERDDSTIRKCRGFTERLGYTAFHVVNLYGFRATKPADLWRAADRVGPTNDVWLANTARNTANTGGLVIAAWGANGPVDRVREVVALLDGIPLWCFGTTNTGQPRHPLMTAYSEPLTQWDPAAA